MLAIVDLLIRLRQVDEANLEFERAKKIGPLNRRLQSFFALTQARLKEARGDKHEAEQMYQAAFELSRKNRVMDLALESIAAWTSLSELHGERHEETLRVISEALPEARAEGRVDIVFNLLLVRSRAYTMYRDTPTWLKTKCRSVRSEAEALGYVNQLAYALSGLAALATQADRLDDATNYAKQAVSLAERLGNDLVLGHTLGLLCSAEFRAADQGGEPNLVDDSIIHGERSVEILSRLPAGRLAGHGSRLPCRGVRLSKDPGKAEEHYAAAMGLSKELGLEWLMNSLREQLPRLAALQTVSQKAIAPGGEA